MDRTMLDLVQIRRALHRIPEPGFAEFKTQQTLLSYIQALPQDRLEIRTWRTGILVRVRGTQPRWTFAYRTDMDGLPMAEQTGLPFASEHPNFMHACGHDMHMAVALGVLEALVREPIPDDVVMVFQPAEEGPGGALPMLQSDEFQHWRPDFIVALHVAPEYPVGTIATRPGILFANTSELFIDLVGKGGHAAFPHAANDMVVAAAHLVTQLQSIVSRNVNPLDAAVVTVGKISSGTKQNIIAETARLEGTIRTLSPIAMADIKARITSLVRGIETGFQCQASIDWGCAYRQVDNHPDLTREFMDWLASDGSADLVECREAMTGEDFGYFLEHIPGFMFWLGVNTPYGLHHAKMAPDEGALAVAVRVVTRYLAWKSKRLHGIRIA
ncbi:N-acetyldiaminopimelate deacetylase [Alicyclobacillus contaminans]|uniref:N-acetyldiaminopimelate deacetylase n=1 Tax=Alicyclobacillus contaminans TaxID=392016 RepID=UPI00047BEF24|nr:N-acetyldiaminopimelate deacetylase [Alicyclobacillus contaminans]